ncbi:threonine aldolase family protein [Teredinibacter turnerae]|uniref:threonine aldolase family protein n=1 Tax=Teredinibacter turnerae TaxID=2426 RepID=UPI0003628BDB|nr:low specificity L-threonine aldolase [Teredinibacter turnerae]
MQQFASDNYAGMCPEALAYLEKANGGHVPAYGEDPYTEEVCERFRAIFNHDCEVFFVFNGTAANSLALSTYCKPYHSVICSEFAHIETDECGAPEFFSHGSKILTAAGEQGRLGYEGIASVVHKRSDVHYPKPKVVSVTQATELGTVYDVNQLRNVQRAAQDFDLKIHMDGARFANALAELKATPAEVTHEVGVDVLCLGGTKNGLAVGDAVIFFNRDDAAEFDYRCKQSGQLASKMRFISAQWLGILENDAWLKYGEHANNCAIQLESELKKIDELELLFPRQANSVFVNLPEHVRNGLAAKGWRFYTFIGAGGVRLMCSWNTQPESITNFIRDLKGLL